LGGEIEVPTVDGKKARVTIPEGAQTGKQFRLRSKGMPVLRSSQFGDLYIQVAVETPVNLTRRQRELLREFEKESRNNSPESEGFFAKAKAFWDGFAS
jgi:molecular chaperone DnaJ